MNTWQISQEINKLGALTKLISLSLAGASVNDAAVNQFESISHLKSIRSLNISNTKLGTESYEKITRFFRQADVKY